MVFTSTLYHRRGGGGGGGGGGLVDLSPPDYIHILARQCLRLKPVFHWKLGCVGYQTRGNTK